ncbi:hypothetical protein DB88DRAFT_498582 [Papiliotrema laurentii]|uniref:Uncharacterized protein n=1 Tax=Papiliotrema laurentii TaxID=5418 RepID=A0AAD9FM82_PAPLA|nr:hypothetical protein DB88DRAFT_498582 [Papiliotrema laurentii]
MILRYPQSAALRIGMLIWLFLSPVIATNTSTIHVLSLSSRQTRPEYVPHLAADLVCRPFGECEPCPSDELDQPFCLPFGNRRLLHCLPASKLPQAGEEGSTKQPTGEVPAWESCGRVIRQEREDFWEFVTANLLFLIVALTILWARSSALAAAQYRQLAARIGIPGGSWRV